MRPGASDARASVEGLLAWWALAGVDQAVSEAPVDWLRPAPRAGGPAAVQATPAAAAPSPAPRQYPNMLGDFHDWLARAPDLPEAAWPGLRVLPTGSQAPRLMIILDTPDAMASLDGRHLAADQSELVRRMAAAIGVPWDACTLASLSVVSAPGGRIEPAIAAQLADRMRHHIGLLAPRALLFLGDQTKRALAPVENARDAGHLPFVNLAAATIPAASVLHPGLMLRQPSAKIDAWRSLRRLIEKV